MKALLFVLIVVSSSCVGSPTAPSAKEWICQTAERCSYPAPYYQRECRRDMYTSSKPCPATPIP